MNARIAVITAGLSEPSSTRLLADRLADATLTALAVRQQQVKVEVVEVRPLAHDITNAMLTGFTAGQLSRALTAVATADAVIAVTPTFQASYSGLFKSFVDVLGIDHQDGLRGTPVLLGATAGTARHSLVLESAMRPLFSYLGALTVPTAVFAASEDWGSAGGTPQPGSPRQGETFDRSGRLEQRIQRAAAELADLVVRPTWRSAEAAGAAGPADDADSDEVEGFVDFSTLLAR